MKDIALNQHESRMFEEAVDAAARVYQHRANAAVQGWVPEFGVDDQPAAPAAKADAVVAAALMATMSSLRDTARDLREKRIANEQQALGAELALGR